MFAVQMQKSGALVRVGCLFTVPVKVELHKLSYFVRMRGMDYLQEYGEVRHILTLHLRNLVITWMYMR